MNILGLSREKGSDMDRPPVNIDKETIAALEDLFQSKEAVSGDVPEDALEKSNSDWLPKEEKKALQEIFYGNEAEKVVESREDLRTLMDMASQGWEGVDVEELKRVLDSIEDDRFLQFIGGAADLLPVDEEDLKQLLAKRFKRVLRGRPSLYTLASVSYLPESVFIQLGLGTAFVKKVKEKARKMLLETPPRELYRTLSLFPPAVWRDLFEEALMQYDYSRLSAKDFSDFVAWYLSSPRGLWKEWPEFADFLTDRLLERADELSPGDKRHVMARLKSVGEEIQPWIEKLSEAFGESESWSEKVIEKPFK